MSGSISDFMIFSKIARTLQAVHVLHEKKYAKIGELLTLTDKTDTVRL